MDGWRRLADWRGHCGRCTELLRSAFERPRRWTNVWTSLHPISFVMVACTRFMRNTLKRSIGGINQWWKKLSMIQFYSLRSPSLSFSSGFDVWAPVCCVDTWVITVTFFFISLTITSAVQFVTRRTEVQAANVTSRIRAHVRAAVQLLLNIRLAVLVEITVLEKWSYFLLGFPFGKERIIEQPLNVSVRECLLSG